MLCEEFMTAEYWVRNTINPHKSWDKVALPPPLEQQEGLVGISDFFIQRQGHCYKGGLEVYMFLFLTLWH